MGKEKKRCHWCGTDPIYIDYHDTLWGVPVYDDKHLFEFLVLEGAQAGLSWITILKRRAGYKKAFADFDVKKVANFSEKKIQSLLKDEGIIRNRLKVRSAVTNAQAFIRVQEEFGSFAHYQWDFVGGKPIQNTIKSPTHLPATSEISDKWSRDLKKRGFSFVGSTILYAHMQAIGMVNDHLTDCFRYREVKALAK